MITHDILNTMSVFAVPQDAQQGVVAFRRIVKVRNTSLQISDHHLHGQGRG